MIRREEEKLTILAVQARGSGIFHGLSLIILRPRMTLTIIGMPYETSRATTDAEMIALKALSNRQNTSSLFNVFGKYLVEPRKINPKIITRAVVKYSAFSGTFNLLCTRAKTREAGNPPSRANAYTMRLDVVMIVMAANRRQTSGILYAVH